MRLYTFALEPVQLGYGSVWDLGLAGGSRWIVALEQDWARLGGIGTIYSEMTVNSLLRMETVVRRPRPSGFPMPASNGASSYNGLNVACKRPYGARVLYSWSHSIDLGSSDNTLFLGGRK